MPANDVSGSFYLLFLFDVCDEILLEELRGILGLEPGGREPTFRHPAPEYVRFQKAPVIERLETLQLDSGERLEGRLKYYDYGVMSVEYELAFAGTWDELVALSSRWITAQEIEKRAAETVASRLERVRPAIVKQYSRRLSEDYSIIHVNSARHPDGSPVSTAELIESRRDHIALLVRGESTALSREEKVEVLQSSMSYYPNDLVVVGWTAAFLYDTPEGAAPVRQLLEYANSQLLEFRHYDELLTRVLTGVYKALDKGTGFLSRWRLAREATRLNTIRLDVRELAERVDNSIKFLSDMFSARLYRLAAAKVGVPDYRKLVDEKLATAGELYQFMVEEFRQGRAFVMELMIVIILIIDLIFLFRGKS
jgi:hypothetical protein